MSNARKFAKNSLALTVASLSVMFLGSIYRIFIANYLSDADFGKYSFIIVYVSYFSALSLFGLKGVITREAAKSPERGSAILRESLKIRYSITLIAFIAAYIIILFLHGKGPDERTGILIYGISLFAVATMDAVESMIIAFEASSYITISALISNTLKIVIGICALRMGYGLMAIFLIYTGISILNAFLSWYFYRIVYSSVKQIEPDSNKKLRLFLIKESLPFLLLNLISRVYYKNDILILSFLKGDKVVGWYSAAYLPVDALLAISFSISSAAYPLMSRMYNRNDEKNLKHLHDSLSKYMMIFFIPIAITLTAVGPELMNLIFGQKYAAAMPTLRLLGWMPVAEAVSCTMGYILAASYKQHITAKITILNAGINLAVCLALIPKYSYWGGAIGTVASAFITVTIVAWVIGRYVHKLDWFSSMAKPLFCGLVATCALFFTFRTAGSWVAWLVGLVIFAITLLVTGTLGKDDYSMVKSIFQRPKTSE